MRKKEKSVTPLTEAQQELVIEHYDFAIKIGMKFAGLGQYKGISVEDLQQEACYGLCVAAQRYSLSTTVTDMKGEVSVAFETYAYNWCYKYIMAAINDEPISMDLDDEESSTDSGQVPSTNPGQGPSTDSGQAEDVGERVDTLLGILNTKEREVVCLIYGIKYQQGVSEDGPMAFSEVAAALRIKTMRVRQIYQAALKKLKNQEINKYGD